MKRFVSLPRVARVKQPGYLYFIHEQGRNNCKIGHTIDLIVRRNNLQVANPNKLVVTAAKVVEDGREAEMMAHEAFKDVNIRGEWFRITQQEAKSYVNKFT